MIMSAPTTPEEALKLWNLGAINRAELASYLAQLPECEAIGLMDPELKTQVDILRNLTSEGF